MKSSGNTALQKALDFIRPRREKFYEEWYNRWAERDFIIGNPIINISNYRKDPNLGAEISMIIRILIKMYGKTTTVITTETAEGIHEHYYRRFVDGYLMPGVVKKGGYIPHLNKTDTVKELLARGWIHEDDSDVHTRENALKIYLKCLIAPLVWPKTFNHHQNAIAKNTKVGIPGRTGTILPKR